jgi:hypothetical protein
MRNRKKRIRERNNNNSSSIFGVFFDVSVKRMKWNISCSFGQAMYQPVLKTTRFNILQNTIEQNPNHCEISLDIELTFLVSWHKYF